MAKKKNSFRHYTDRQLIDYIKSIGKSANERLRTLEGKRKGFEDLSASSIAYQYILAQKERGNINLSETNKGEVKFNLKTKGLSHKELLERAQFIRDFSETTTSTISGIKSTQKLSFEKFKEQYKKATKQDYEGTYKDYSELYTNTIVKEYQKMYGSDETERLVATYGQEMAIKVMKKAVENYMDITNQYEYGNILYEDWEHFY